MIHQAPRFLPKRLLSWLNSSSIQERLGYLTLLNVSGLLLLLILSLLNSQFKESYFDAIEDLNQQKYQVQHFTIETERLQNSIQNYFYTPDENLEKQIDTKTWHLLEELDALQKTGEEFSAHLQILRASLDAFMSGFGELKQINQNISKTKKPERDTLRHSHDLRTQVMETKIRSSQRVIAETATTLEKSYTATGIALHTRYTHHLRAINTVAVMLALLIIALSFAFSSLILNSIRRPLSGLLNTVEAFSSGDFAQPIPDVGGNEFGQLAGALKDFRKSAIQHLHAEQALRESESRFRALSDMASDFFWEQNKHLQYSGFSGKRAGELLACDALKLGIKPWENPRNSGYAGEWKNHQNTVEAHQPFRDFEFSLTMPDGSLTCLQASGDPIFAMDGTFAGYRGTAKDISSHKAIEAEIRRLNQTLEQRVIERTRELRDTNDQLSQAMEQLVQSEKLASLGNLVAGVAHELNTPLGNALVASTAMRDQVRNFIQHVEAGAVRKSDLREFTQHCATGCELIERSCYRASSLVANFKQVAIDQTTAQRRTFDLRQTVEEVITTMTPTLRRLHHKITIDIPQGLVLDSYPGSLDQVINNIVNNASVHAFEKGICGEIRISANALNEKEILISLADNGVGIPEERQSQVFDPFFTTRLGQGGSGLGLYIVYNIVTSLLGGQIQVSSESGKGACFNLRIPVTAPEAQRKSFSSLYRLPPHKDEQSSLSKPDGGFI